MMKRALLYPTALILCCFGTLFGVQPSAQAQTLVLAQISDRPKKDFRQLRPMAEHIQRQLRPYGFDRADVQLYPDVQSLMSAIRQQRVHWVTETLLTSARLVQANLAKPVALKWKRNQGNYHGLIYVRHDSPVQTLHHLRGRRIAFEHHNSFSSFYLPALTLRQAGLTLQALPHPGDAVPPNHVGFVFSRNERNNLLWVHKGITDAGSLNNGDWDLPGRLPDALKQDMRIIYRSPAYPRAFELVTPALPPEAAAALEQALLSLQQEQHGHLLSRYEQTERLTPITAEHRALLQQLDLELLP